MAEESALRMRNKDPYICKENQIRETIYMVRRLVFGMIGDNRLNAMEAKLSIQTPKTSWGNNTGNLHKVMARRILGLTLRP